MFLVAWVEGSTDSGR